jgi:hypothetical protein
MRLCTVSLLLSACYMQPSDSLLVTDGGDGSTGGEESSFGLEGGAGETKSGLVEDGDMRLYWAWYGNEGWAEGTCVQMLLKNRGSTVSNWSAELQLNSAITAWTHYDGAFLFPYGDKLLVEPETSGTLSGGASLELSFCAEPRVEILALDMDGDGLSTTNDSDADTDADSDSDTDSDADTDADTDADADADAGPQGSVESADGEVLLEWDPNGTSNGGACTQLTVTNQGSIDYANWWVDVTFDADFELTDSWNWALVDTTSPTLRLAPAWDQTLFVGSGYTGTLCLDETAEPIAVSIDAPSL